MTKSSSTNRVSTEQMTAFLSEYEELWSKWLATPDLTREADDIVVEMYDLFRDTFFDQGFGN